MIFVNFKTYQEGTGARAVNLVHELCDCETETSIPVIPVVQVVDARECVRVSDGEVWAQDVDDIKPGPHTGWVLPESVAEAGVKGTFLAHSESNWMNKDLETQIKRCREVGLKSAAFAQDLDGLRVVANLKPDYLVYEPLELIASETTSVVRSQPQIIGQAVEIAKSAGIPLIVGAGIKDSQDVKKSLELGATGVAVSSAIVLAEDPKKVVLELAKGFK